MNAKRKPRARRPRSNTLVIHQKRGQTRIEAEAAVAIGGLESNAAMAVRLSSGLFGELDLTQCVAALQNSVGRIHSGDLRDQEALLAAQAVTLNAMFIDLLRRATGAGYLKQFECYMRLALKAQSQNRATVETLTVMKNPPTVFARQANIAQGPQQVNNAILPMPRETPGARAGDFETVQNEVLEAHGDGLDVGAAGTASTGNKTLAPMGTLDWSTDGCR